VLGAIGPRPHERITERELFKNLLGRLAGEVFEKLNGKMRALWRAYSLERR